MNCSFCNNALRETQKFCNLCGTPNESYEEITQEIPLPDVPLPDVPLPDAPPPDYTEFAPPPVMPQEYTAPQAFAPPPISAAPIYPQAPPPAYPQQPMSGYPVIAPVEPVEKEKYFFGKGALTLCLILIGVLSASTVTFLVLFLSLLGS